MHTLSPLTHLQALADATDRNLLAIDSQGQVTLLSALAAERLDMGPGTSLKKTYPGFWQQAKQVVDGQRQSCEITLRIAGREYLAGVNPYRIEGVIRGAVCVLVDGSQLDTMTRRLPSFQILSRELDTIINSSSDGLFVCDAKANVIRMNPASEKIHQLAASEIIGRNMRELIESGFIDRSAALEASHSKGRVSLLQDKDGRKLMSIATPVFDEQGELIRVVVSERDITEIDNLQRELERQEAFKDGFRDQMLAMQQTELESRQIIARSPVMIRALEQAMKAAKADSSVLLLGESGVGKGLIADLLHQRSSRHEAPLIKINCGAIPETLIEAELFGYEKGAFTGALASGKPGHFELADGGTLFLDEIAELPPAAQVKLLHFLEDGQITRLGDTRSRSVNVRILVATHQNLNQRVEEGQFRLDLYYRLNVIPIQVPPLRERIDCLIPLIRHYIDYFCDLAGSKKRLSKAALDALAHYSYPGNVRELMNICERLVVMTETDLIGPDDLPGQISQSGGDAGLPNHPLSLNKPLQQTLDEIEREVLAKACRDCSNQTEIATALGINQSTVARKLKKHGLR